MTLVYACIAPHGGEIIPLLASKSDPEGFRKTREAMKRIAREAARSKPDTFIIASPHNLRLFKRIAVVTAENSSGKLENVRKSVTLHAKCNVDLGRKLLESSARSRLPVVGANFGTSEGPASDMPMDWGTLVPLWFMSREMKLRFRILIVTPSREIPLLQNFEFGRVIAKVVEKEKSRIVFVASADQAHAHSRLGPYGFSRAAAEYDRLVVEAIKRDRMDTLLHLRQTFVERAKPDSLWQLAMLAGVGSEVKLRPKMISYEVPTYYGMICASFERIR
jgi:aromatic ring-opening dioxygenase LigB subunit